MKYTKNKPRKVNAQSTTDIQNNETSMYCSTQQSIINERRWRDTFFERQLHLFPAYIFSFCCIWGPQVSILTTIKNL